MSMVASPRLWPGIPPTTSGVNLGSENQSAKLSMSRWSNPSKANTATVMPAPVNPSAASASTL